MASSLSELRKQRGGFDKLQKEVEKLANPEKGSSNSNEDTRFWQPEVDQAGNGSAIIRFLPAPKGEDIPWIREWSHGFKGPSGKWYIEKSLTTIGQVDPVGELNNSLWASGLDSDKEIARSQKRRLSYISNVLIVSDPKHPENEGQVKLFRFGKKIFDKIKDVMNPEFEDDEQINPFDFWEGANFKLKIRKVEGYRNYDKSEFASKSALSEDDGEIEEIWNKEYSLQEFLDPSKFKSYDELKKKLDMVLGAAPANNKRADDEDPFDVPASKPAEKPKKEEPKVSASVDDSDEDYFAALAADD